MKRGITIQNALDFFKTIKQYMLINYTNRLQFKTLKQYQHSHQENLLDSIVSFLDQRARLHRDTSNEQYVRIFLNLLNEARLSQENFKITNMGVTYTSKYAVQDAKELLKQIQNNPEGILVDDELLRFTTPKIRDLIRELISNRKVIAARSKGIEKSKDKQDNFQGYYLFPFPQEVKDTFSFIFKTSIDALNTNSYSSQRQRQSREQKMQRIYQTKTSAFRTQFENICSANINKGQEKIGQLNNGQSFQKIYNNWNPINKMSIANFEESAQEWFKSRKV